MGSASLPCGAFQLIWQASPNFGLRRDGQRPSLIVLHYTAMDSAKAALDRLCDPEFEVSAHYLIAQDGTVAQLVHEVYRAWHAGAGSWQGQGDVNSRSIGIELCNRGDHAFPAAQIDALKALLKQVQARWNIPASGVIGHSDMAPDRKQDPGPLFPWAELVAAGLAVGPGQAQGDIETFDTDLMRFGYSDGSAENRRKAFRDRFLPGKTGVIDQEDANTVAGLLV